MNREVGDNTKMVTVLIPTFKRPELLRTALDSISKQTYKHFITNVIVSENGLEDDSRALCDEFPDLNITYVYQDVQLPHLKHWKWLISQVKEGYTAFLCDDDWWNVFHIESAINSLNNNPHAVSYFSNFSYALNEHKVKLDNYPDGILMGFGRKSINNYSIQTFDANDVFGFSLLFTPFHFSSVVCKANVLAEASNIFDRVHQTYADRTIWPIVSTYGNVIFNPLQTTIVRYHPGQDSNNFSPAEWKNHNQNGSSLIMNLANDYNINIEKHINGLYEDMTTTEKLIFSEYLERVFPDRDKVNWYKGYSYISDIDNNSKILAEKEFQRMKREKSFKIVVGRKIAGFIRKIIR